MDLKRAIELNREPLIVLVVSLFAMIGLTEGGSIERIRRPLYRKVLALLRPAEAAVRRLIIVAARGLAGKPHAARSTSSGRSGSGKGNGRSERKSKGQRRSLFRLFDPLRRIVIGGGHHRRKGPVAEPRIHVLGPSPGYGRDLYTGWGTPAFRQAQLGLSPVPAAAPPAPDDSVSGASLCRRLAAALDALKDIPGQAQRYARWRDKPYEQRRPKRDDALRTGPAPYLKRNSKHEVHAILAECHRLAREALKPDIPKPDTS